MIVPKTSIYENGKYLEATSTWHSEDSPWKAQQIVKLVKKNGIQCLKVAEIGCGVGRVLHELSKDLYFSETCFSGFDISTQAIGMSQKYTDDRIKFYCEDLLQSRSKKNEFDVLLVIDVFEHVTDYMGFIQLCTQKAQYKIFHIPLEIHASAVIRDVVGNSRYSVGHLHYFTAKSALATLVDSGNTILDFCYTNPALDLYMVHPSFKKAVANIPRYVISKFNLSLAARLFGGYSLLVLTT